MLYFLIAAASFSGFYSKWHFAEPDVEGEDYRFSFDGMVDGTAYRPYVYRQMLPTLVNWIARAAPVSFETWLYSIQAPVSGKSSDPAARRDARIDPLFDSATAENPKYFFRYLVIYIATFLFALLALYTLRQVCVELEMRDPAATIAPAVFLLLLPFLQSVGGFFYDYSELAFFAIAVWVALRRNWGWLIPVAALATWNKESFLFFVQTLYPLLRSRTSRARALLAVSAAGAACIAVYLPLRFRFAANHGGSMELHWRDQLQSLLHPLDFLFNMEKTYGLMLPRVCTLLVLALCVWTAARVWWRLPHVVKKHATIAAAINLPLYVLFCWPGELRNFSLIFVALVVVMAEGFSEWAGAHGQIGERSAR